LTIRNPTKLATSKAFAYSLKFFVARGKNSSSRDGGVDEKLEKVFHEVVVADVESMAEMQRERDAEAERGEMYGIFKLRVEEEE
jgi:hypothetical protein